MLIIIFLLNNVLCFIAESPQHNFNISARLINVADGKERIKFQVERKLDIPLTGDSLIKTRVNSRRRQEMPVLLDHLSNKLIKLFYQKDLETFALREERRAKLSRWKMHPNPKRLSPILFKLGDVFMGRVTRLYPTYALLDIGSTCFGVLHARDISDNWTLNVESSLTLGKDYKVIVIGIDENGHSIRLSMRENEIERVNKLVDKFKNLTLIESNNIKTQFHIPPCVSQFPYPYKIYKLENRKTPQEYEINQIVFGKVTRSTGLGYFVDIGATVDAFLHCNDAKIIIPYNKKKLNIKVGSYLDKLFIKEINSVRNRISVTIKTIDEDLEERIIKGKDSIEDQMGYPNTPLYNECLDNFANYIEFLKLSGLFDGFLREVGGTRDSSLKYLAYLTNIYNQKLLKEDQKSLYVERFTPRYKNGQPDPKYAYRKINIKTKKGRNEFRDRYNRLSDEILKLDSSLIYPDKKSVFNVGEASVWNNQVSTPINERTNRVYFSNLNEQIRHALDVVQGNFVDDKPNDAKNLLDNFKILKEIFDSKLSNSVNVDDSINRDYRSLIEDIISLRRIGNKVVDDHPIKSILNQIDPQIDIDINSEDSEASKEVKSEASEDSKSNESNLDLNEIMGLNGGIDGIDLGRLMDMISSYENDCSNDPELSSELEKLKMLTMSVRRGNLTPPIDGDLDSECLLSESIAYDTKRISQGRMRLKDAKALIPPDPIKYIPRGSEIEGCWYILLNLLKINRFKNMLSRFNISLDQPPDMLIKQISDIVPRLIVKRINVDKKLTFEYTEDHSEDAERIPN